MMEHSLPPSVETGREYQRKWRSGKPGYGARRGSHCRLPLDPEERARRRAISDAMCRRIWLAQHHEAIRVCKREFRRERRAQISAYNRRYVEANGPLLAAKKRAKRLAANGGIPKKKGPPRRYTPEELKERQRIRREATKELARAYHQQRYSREAAKYKARAAQRRAQLKGARTEGQAITHREIFERDGWVCHLCGRPTVPDARWPNPQMPSIDHIVPLSSGGAHSRDNLACAHLRCNLAKGRRMSPTMSLTPTTHHQEGRT